MIKRLVLGEGPTYKKEPDKTTIDIVPKWADIVCDLNESIPDISNKFDYVEAHHIFEHIESTKQLKKIIQWCYDLLEEGGIFDITVPYWHSESAVECIEHCRFFNENSFMNYYSNPYSKEMQLPQFKLVSNGIENVGSHKQVHIRLTK
jgi:predicted SAM-dependent methyltransferase